MECNIIRDLMPLCIDGCCSKESAEIVQEHIQNCPDCKTLYENMRTPSEVTPIVPAPKKLKKIQDWKASILQSVLLFVSFAMITLGVSLEAATPLGILNGYWALSIVIPSTGFLLSLINWYFVRLYQSRKRFSNSSLIATLVITACAYIGAGFHYALDFAELLSAVRLDAQPSIALFCGVGLVLTAVFCVLSKFLSDKYATMLGKE